MSVVNKFTADRNQRILLELVQKPGNDICADCKARNPRWASHNLGIFICVNCASIHRKIGTHITKVYDLFHISRNFQLMDELWMEQEELNDGFVDEGTSGCEQYPSSGGAVASAYGAFLSKNMKNMGNVKSNGIYNSNEIRHPPPPNLEDSERDSELEQYIRSKYEYKRFFDKSALVASKLGPSRSASSIPSRSSTLPQSDSASLGPSQSASAAVPASSTSTPYTATSIAATAKYTPISRPSPSPAPPAQQYTPTPQPLANLQLVSQPIQRSSTLPSSPQNGAGSGVWDDLVSLQTSSTSSSTLPLQYQSSVSPAFTGMPLQNMEHNSFQQTAFSPGSASGYQIGMTATGMNSNPYQQQQFATNPYSQPQSQSLPAYGASSMSTPFSAPSQFNQGMSSAQQSYGQQLFANQMQMRQQQQQPQVMSASAQGQFFQTQLQSQSALQIQVPGQQGTNGFLSPSPVQPFMSAPVGQTQFLTPSPNQQFVSRSPQPSPQPMGMTGSPGQPQMMMGNAGQQQQQRMMASPGQQQQMMGSSPGAFMSNGPMQQQYMGGAPQQMMLQGQFGGGYSTQGYMQGGYPAQQQQWGTM